MPGVFTQRKEGGVQVSNRAGGKTVGMLSFTQTMFEELCGHPQALDPDPVRVFWDLWSENAPGYKTRLQNVCDRLAWANPLYREEEA